MAWPAKTCRRINRYCPFGLFAWLYRVHRSIWSRVYRGRRWLDGLPRRRERRAFTRWSNLFVGTCLVWLLLGGCTAIIDPFGVSAATAAYSQRIVDRLTAPYYASPGQDRIAVVIIDDATLDQWGVGWPPPYDTYSNIIYRVLRCRPKALFMDIMFERLRKRDEDSYRSSHAFLARAIPRSGIPVIFAQSGPGAPNLYADIPGTATAIASWDISEYPLWNPTGDGGRKPSVAAQLYGHLCAGQAPGTPYCPAAIDAEHAPPMAVQWGCAVSRVMQEKGLLAEDDQFVDPSMLHRIGKSIWIGMRNMAVGLSRNAMGKPEDAAPYAVTLMAHDLDTPQARDILKDRVVLVGTFLSGSSDLVLTPNNGQLAGVYYHAMALDNLTRYGADYYTNPPSAWGIFLLTAVCMSIFSTVMLVNWPNRGGLYKWLSALAVCTLMGVFYFYSRFAPQNWLGYSLLIIIAYKMQTQKKPTASP